MQKRKMIENVDPSHNLQGVQAQCGNLSIFLPVRFPMKSILGSLITKRTICTALEG